MFHREIKPRGPLKEVPVTLRKINVYIELSSSQFVAYASYRVSLPDGQTDFVEQKLEARSWRELRDKIDEHMEAQP